MTISDKAKKTTERLNQFMDKHIYPNESNYTKQIDDSIVEVQTIQELIKIVKNLPGFKTNLIIKRIPRVIKEPDTRKMSVQIAKGVAEKSLVRLVKVAAGASK